MSKKGKKNKKDEVPVIPTYHPEDLTDKLSISLKANRAELIKSSEILAQKMLDNNDYSKQNKEIKKSVKKVLTDRVKENERLKKEQKMKIEEREEFERQCKEDFDKQYEDEQEKKKIAIEKITDEMTKVKQDLEKVTEEKTTLLAKVEQLELEIQKINNENTVTIQKYETKIKEINEKHHDKLKQTTDIFERFLQNNPELLTTDLYSVYRTLKTKFDTKLKECDEYKNKNEMLCDQNHMFKLSMNNNDNIINECARAQVEAKKKNKKLTEEIEQKDKIIEQMKMDYQNQLNGINDKFTQVLKDNESEINSLKNELNSKNKRLYDIEKTSKNVMNSRSDLEVFFIEQLRECKIEIARQKKIEEERKKNLLPFLNLSVNCSSQINNNSGSTNEESVYLTTAKKMEIKDMDAEVKEKLLRNLLVRLGECGFNSNKGISKIKTKESQ